MNDKLKNIITWILIIGLSIALIISLTSNGKNNSFTELSSYKEKIALYEENLKSYETKIKELTEEVEDLKLFKEEKQKELDKYVEQNTTLTEQNTAYQNEISKLNDKIKKTSNESLKKEYEKQIVDLKSKISTNETTIKENTDKFNKLENTIKEKDKIIEENSNLVFQYKEKIIELEDSIKELKETITAHENTIKEKDEKIKEIEYELKYIKRIYEGDFISDIETKDKVVLDRDVQMLSIATLNNREVTLDLNGYNLNLYEINLNSSILRIIDSSEEKTGVIELNYFYGYNYSEDGLNNKAGIQVNSDSTLTIDGGIFKGEYTIKVNDGGKIIVNTGSFEQDSARYTTSLIKINKGGKGYIYGGIFGKNGQGGIQNVGYLEVDARLIGENEEEDSYTEQRNGSYNLKMFGDYFVYNLDPLTNEHGTVVFKHLHNALESMDEDGNSNPMVINAKGTVDLSELYYVPNYDFVISSYDKYAERYYPEYQNIKLDESKIIYKDNQYFELKSKDDETLVLKRK